MSELPDRESLRTTIAAFDATTQKVLGGLVLAMMHQPDSVQDREWLSEALTQIAAKAHDLPDPLGQEDVQRLRAWILAHRDPVLNAAFAVFVRSAEDLQAVAATEELTYERAVAAAMVYLAPPPD